MDKRICYAVPVVSMAMAATLAVLLPLEFGGGLAQMPGEDLLSIFFADARTVISKSLVTKADSYFHGGVNIENCKEDEIHQEDAHREDGGPQPEAEPKQPEEARAEAAAFPDPWAWINARVHVQEYRHLEGDELAELVPWIWAACRTSPHNIEAYEMGWYVLAKMQKKAYQGLAVLEEGILNNPDNLQLEFTRGQSLYSDVKDKAASEAAFKVAREKAIRKAKGDLSSLPQEEAEVFSRALAYLAFFAKERGDRDSIRAYLRESESVAPDYAATKQIRKMLAEPQ